MTELDNLAFIEAYLDNWRKDPPDLHAVFHPEGTLLPPGNSEPVNVEGAQRIVEGTRKAIPDVTLEILHWAERDGHIFIEWEMKGTVRGKQVAWRGINRNLLRGSKSTEAVSYWDRQSLFEQFGASDAGPDLLSSIENESD
ncbi:MAG: nuclear transport factor 2 family protein [Myxococcota bacterium]